MTTILVTGGNGLLGQRIIYALRKKEGIKCISTSRGENRMKEQSGYTYESMDITDKLSVEKIFEKYSPQHVIHTAAMTNVDACEMNKEEAVKQNVSAVENLILQCRKYNTHLVHLSTDFVFNGENGPYVETDAVDPLSHYALTKVESEKRVIESDLRWAIIRTIIIYGTVDDNSRSNVVLWVINALKNKKAITVINDQYRSPTFADDLADACIAACLKNAIGIFHVSGRELMNILDIAKIVADYFKLDAAYIKPVSSLQLNQPALRPPVTGFIIDKAVNELDFHPHTFLEGLSIIKSRI
jgi:dTDP-4-dehydrorhamnose reductase